MSFRKTIINKKDRIIALLSLTFIALVTVQSVLLYFQASAIENKNRLLAENMAESLAVQASTSVNSEFNLVKAVIHQFGLDQPSLIPILTNKAQKLNAQLNGVLTGYKGFLVFDGQGEIVGNYLVDNDIHIKHYLQQYVFHSASLIDQKGRLEMSSGEKNRNLYFNFKYLDQLGRSYYFSVVRKVNIYADTIMESHFDGFEIWLMDNERQNIIIKSGELIEFNQRKPLNVLTVGKEVVKTIKLQGSSWSLVVLADEKTWISAVKKLLPTYAFFTLMFILLFVAFRLRVFFLRNRHVNNISKINIKNERSEQALACIDEVVITTTINGKIIYCNNSAGKWLGKETIESILGKQVSKVFPFKGMPWLKTWDNMDQQHALYNFGETKVDMNGNSIYLNISRHFSKDKSESSIIWVLRDISRQSVDRELLDISRARYQALYNGCGVSMWHVDVSMVREWLSYTNHDQVKSYIQQHPSEYASLHSAFHIIEVNDAALNLHHDIDKEAFIERTTQLFYEHNHDLIIEFSERIAKNELRFSLESEVIDLDGERRSYLIDVTLDVVGQDQALLSFIDITDRITAEKALKKSEQFWEGVIKALPDTVYVNDLTTKAIRYNSRHIGELLGYSKDELIDNESWRELLHPDDIKKIDSAVEQLRNMAPGEVHETNVRLKHCNGMWRTLRFRDCVYAEKGAGLAQYYVGTARDITEEEDAKVQLSYSERQYRLLAEGMNDMIFTLDKDYRLSYVSSSIRRMLGHKVHQVLREGLSMIFSTESRRLLGESIQTGLKFAQQNTINKDNVKTLDLDAQTLYGLPVILETQISILRDESGEIEGTLITCRDVTQRRHIEKEARTSAEVFDNSSEAILVTNSVGIINKVNKAFTSLTGFNSDQVIGSIPTKLLSQEVSAGFLQEIQHALLIEGYWQGEINYCNKYGESRPSWTGITAIKDDLGQVQSNIIIASDINERKISEARIERLAYFDPLTGLPNRSQMHETLEKFMQEDGQLLALLFIDLDRFKPINDTMGHPAGDQVLKQVAQRLASSVREQDLVARIGGDEFTVIMPALNNLQEAMEEAIDVSEMILHQMMLPFVIDDHQLYLSASVGVALFPENAMSGMELLRNADTAMYHAKAMGKNNFQFYAEEMNIKAMERLELENNLHLALRRNEFELVFQAQWDTKENKLYGLETLLRWRRPHHGIVGPDKFIPIIEETGLIVPIGEWVFRAACEQIIEWQETGFVVPKVAINLSARQFKDTEMLDRICKIVDKTGVDPELIELELTESILMDDVERTLAVLNEARNMGFGLSIDDFGTGYSSLSYLKQFPVNNLKIDQSFIRNLPYSQEDGQITKTIVAMANNLGLGVIAEGVETLEQRKFLEEIGCYRVQGYMYSFPVSADVIAQDYLDTENEYYLEH